MAAGLRILIASPLGHVISAPLKTAFEGSTISVATTDDEFTAMISGTVRYDVVAADLIWNKPEMEWNFDGLDVIDRLRQADRAAPVLLATQGHSLENDHLEEARLRPEVFGVAPKADGLSAIMDGLRSAALGRRLPDPLPVAPKRAPMYELFADRRGQTAARMAGAIAAGRVSDNATLADVAKVSPSTANKVTSHYLGPMIQQRGEHDDRLPLTQGAVYRWCGLHARYLTSWCRRNGHADVL
ncbi:MAG: response regulator [Gordonia sp. (in: high G+C Gram-positive bacteria)]|uniref:response regulator n=1 Tax=Gordonia sp. (in: high G+C Gram-positive bacteria) TaxID=84139 RepID=UPI0039E59B5B